MEEDIKTLQKEFDQKGMTASEFEEWSEKLVERHNRIVDLCNNSDLSSIIEELGISYNYLTPLILVMLLFGSTNYSKKVTKEEVMTKYDYMKDINSIIKTEEEISKENASINEQLL